MYEACVIVSFLGWEVQCENAIHPRRSGIVQKLFYPRLVHQVVIDVQDDGDLRVAPNVGDSL